MLLYFSTTYTFEEVMKDYPGSDVATLQKLSTALACETKLGKEEMYRGSMHG